MVDGSVVANLACSSVLGDRNRNGCLANIEPDEAIPHVIALSVTRTGAHLGDVDRPDQSRLARSPQTTNIRSGSQSTATIRTQNTHSLASGDATMGRRGRTTAHRSQGGRIH